MERLSGYDDGGDHHHAHYDDCCHGREFHVLPDKSPFVVVLTPLLVPVLKATITVKMGCTIALLLPLRPLVL